MFSELIEFAPNHFTANSAYGLALMEAGRADESLPYFARAAQIKPDDPQPAANYADALLRLGRMSEAAHWLETALNERDPDCPVLNSLLAYTYLDLDRSGEAVPHLRKALESYPFNLGWRIELIRALFEDGQSHGAHQEINRLHEDGYQGIRGFDDLIPFYVNWWRGGENRHAWNFFRQALRDRPDHILLLRNAAWLIATDPAPPVDAAEAVHLAERALKLVFPPDPVLLDTLAAALAATGRFEEAIPVAEQASARARDMGLPHLVRATKERLTAYHERRPWREEP